MKLATTLTSILLVLALAIVGCDSGGDGGNGGNGGDECDPACEAGFTCSNGTCVEDNLPGDDAVTGDDTTGDECVAACTLKCGMVGDCDCGGCDAGFECVDATHTCAPVVEPGDCDTACANKECGDGGVAGCNCGACEGDETCNTTTGVCETGCVPECTGKQCGPDGCGGSCGLCPCVGCDPSATMCNDVSGMCEAAAALSCTGINDCMATCNPNDQACIQDCMNQGSAEAQQQLNGLIQCLIDNGAQQCPPGDAQCQNDIIMEFCMDEYTACFPGGELTCSEVFDCMAGCAANDQACLQACYADGTMEAQNQYQAIASCVIEQCGEQPTEECFNAAQQGACAAVFSDCFNLGKPGFATGPNGASSAGYVNMKTFLMGLDKDKLYN
jgi:hypothetical protein